MLLQMAYFNSYEWVVFYLEKAVAPHSSTLAWRIPWTEEPGRLQSMGSLGVGHDWATSLSLFTFIHWRRKWQPTPVFLPGESQGMGEPGGLPSMGSHRVGHNWSDLAAAAAVFCCMSVNIYICVCIYIYTHMWIYTHTHIKHLLYPFIGCWILRLLSYLGNCE